jgi:type IV pilus assembly protein PilW
MSARDIAVSSTRVGGVTLIELMVALAIGSLVIVGAITVYMQSRNTYRTNETAARLQEVARYAMDTIEPDVRLAGFWGLTNRWDLIQGRAKPTETRTAIDGTVSGNCGTNWTVNLEFAIDGRDKSYGLGCTGTNPVSWGDVLVVRRASSDTVAPASDRIQLQSTRISAVLFNDGTRPAGFDATNSETRDLVVHAYYVSEILPSPNGVRQFALRRQTLIGGSPPTIRDEEIIPGVEDLQVQFGVGPAGTTVKRYVNPGSVPAGWTIFSARIWLRVIAEDREIGFKNDTDWEYANADYGVFNDDRRRVLISKTIQIRNSFRSPT